MHGRDRKNIYIRAVDGERTKYCHQGISFSKPSRKTRDLNIIHYTANQPSGKLDVDKAFMENVCDALTDTKALLTFEGRERANNAFSQVMGKIKTDRKSHFLLNVPTPAITFDIGFSDNFNVEMIDFRLTTAVMSEKLSCESAYQNITSNSADLDLKTWHDLIMHQKYGEIIPYKMGFEEITHITTSLIQKYMCNYAVRNKLGCIFKILPESTGYKQYSGKCIYGSTLDFDEQIKIAKADSSRAVLPATANRESVDSLNLFSLATFKQDGTNLYTPDFLKAIVNYKMTPAFSYKVA